MKTRSKIKLILLIFLVIIVGLSIAGYRIYNQRETEKTLNINLFEKKWIQDNKNKMIDIAILNNLNLFGNDGKGIFFSFLNDFEKVTELEFNKIPYNVNGEVPKGSFAFRVAGQNESLTDKDLLFYEDNYVILGKRKQKIANINDIDKVNIGVLVRDKEEVTKYINNNSLNYVIAENINVLTELLNEDQVNYIILPQNMYITNTLKNNYHVLYMFSNLSKRYVLTLNGSEERLNSIIKKHYNVWVNNNLARSYDEEKFNLYSSEKNLTDESKAAFRGKRYIYGYLNNPPYEIMAGDRFIGISGAFINGFADFAGIEFTYKRYNSVSALNNAIKNGDIDITISYYNFKELNNELYTEDIIYADYLILAHNSKNIVLDSVQNLNNYNVHVLRDVKISEYIRDNTGAIIKTHDGIDSIVKEGDGILLIDYNTYMFYKNNKLKNHYIVLQGRGNVNYNYIISNKPDNILFHNVFQYYLSGINHSKYRAKGLNDIIIHSNTIDLAAIWIYAFLIPAVILFMLIAISKTKKLKKIKKQTRSKYIDPLTSLKNRYYLNTHISKWDENCVYPQAILIIDINGLKEVNDNYGHDEGDNLIRATANCLINNQLENTDIIRTDGDEFTIYMIGYNETQVIAYMRKLYRLLKELPYGRGASIGYSMILDDIKMVDDAINEAVLDMITNKENRTNNEIQ
jgi:diguanylate cyclase (GGDEF)-like protein